ncbi:hypothetical protein PHYBLDRAFT_174900 [Phycomyces blakesleeanus NRRL 1555(-)]|uniref:Uncharacterized protein n=1 Tax=Phycomyces blakesleeanus (strain ATCC 8743b / DSM 1359 / FGSC 10004 / NBRC 33097 / NRRL 1555) TaxID=763407 RepID=A0A162ZHV5_PHYB8|nr:hypothetical protein PHYBLDRAFT_174900 [Phycomyces blakesleeanus NRRL 1555(-)]OAD66881.1 hypothetical protein PHYBLDRAFT_174900 [Phycomyces blakesleeanus NRRL 1555(-)]|eukprot:XP_018284921.1 hypothetical protein PHYBLDRAFT_174900 [Phycomyces blakesleeanus NRRL 1555(-)]
MSIKAQLVPAFKNKNRWNLKRSIANRKYRSLVPVENKVCQRMCNSKPVRFFLESGGIDLCEAMHILKNQTNESKALHHLYHVLQKEIIVFAFGSSVRRYYFVNNVTGNCNPLFLGIPNSCRTGRESQRRRVEEIKVFCFLVHHCLQVYQLTTVKTIAIKYDPDTQHTYTNPGIG